MIRITGEGCLGHSVRVTTDGGQGIMGVSSLVLRITPDDLVRADVEVVVAAVDVNAHPLLGLDTVTAAAAAHGFRLVPTLDEG